ncbi:MAG: ATP-binding cassette domain-containing protein [Anaerolineaceae bacterium]|nr:ATP-binding cassette domain-containing protein [Anaerolineaceae bacterium]MBR6088756.1 ATP-binding cassette domain-containing protein [Anaerolineaceae bacterium]
MNNVIEIKKLTKDYGSGRGIFDIDLDIARGEMVGFAGTNGSGKTTTIRHIMGFIQPTKGAACVNGLEAWQHSSEYVREIGYVPGEIAFPDLSTGTIFLKSQADFLNLKDLSYAQELIEHLQLDPGALLRRMSKGMKQKTAIVAALMADPAIIILDEPTTGLDPLMRDAFLEIIRAEHEKGKTIFMSSHMFEELETTCDRVALISNGRLVSIADMEKIRHPETRDYKIEFNDGTDYEKFKTLGFEIVRDQPKYQQVTVSLSGDRLNDLFLTLKGMDVRFVSEVKYNLEKYFHEKLGREEEDE